MATVETTVEVDVDLDDFDDDEIREEFYARELGVDDGEDGMDEVLDLIAEAARTSRYAKRAYELLFAMQRAPMTLVARQMLIAGRMGDVA